VPSHDVVFTLNCNCYTEIYWKLVLLEPLLDSENHQCNVKWLKAKLSKGAVSDRLNGKKVGFQQHLTGIFQLTRIVRSPHMRSLAEFV
jgi:hypothetical protein